MRIFYPRPWIIGLVVFLLSSVFIGQLMGPVTCRDGWHSASIGRQGACSHHGGVDHSKNWLNFWLSLALSLAAAIGCHRLQNCAAIVRYRRKKSQGTRPTSSQYRVIIALSDDPKREIVEEVEAMSELHATNLVMTARFIKGERSYLVGCQKTKSANRGSCHPLRHC